MILAFLILAGFAFAFVGMLVDVDRLRARVDLDELWDDEIGAGRGAAYSSGTGSVATTPAASAGDESAA